MATGEAPAEITGAETPEIVKTIQEAVRIYNNPSFFVPYQFLFFKQL